MPPLRLIQRALSQASERFALELAAPRAQAPQWSGFEWDMARAAAVLHGVSPLLASTLRWQGPASWQQFLREQRQATARRRDRIGAFLQRLNAEAQRAQVGFVALKGAALHRLGIYLAGERPTADIDLLVAPHAATRMGEVLARLDYRRAGEVWKHLVYEPVPHCSAPALQQRFGEHADAPIKIDLHTRITERLPRTLVDESARIAPALWHAGSNDYPSCAALMRHLLLHAAGNMSVRGLRLLQLHDIALLAPHLSHSEWDQLTRAEPATPAAWWALPVLRLTARYYPSAIPTPILAALEPLCPRALMRRSRHQRLSDVSLVALGIEAFPGIGWSTSLGERLRLIYSRVRPDAEQRAVRALTAHEAWAAPSAWTHLSQARRAWRWLLTRPPRQATMFAVHAALANQRSDRSAQD